MMSPTLRGCNRSLAARPLEEFITSNVQAMANDSLFLIVITHMPSPPTALVAPCHITVSSHHTISRSGDMTLMVVYNLWTDTV